MKNIENKFKIVYKIFVVIILIFHSTINYFFGQMPVGFFSYGPVFSWANHISVKSDGLKLVMAGTHPHGGYNWPHFVVTDNNGAVLADREVGNDYGEMYGSLILANGDIYLGGTGGWLGSSKKYIVKYNSAMTQVFAKDYGAGYIRYLIEDAGDIVAVGFNNKPCILKINSAGTIIWYKEYNITGDAYSIHQSGSNYYITGSFDEAGNARSFILSVKASDGSVNWCNTYVGGTFAPHFTGMSPSPTGIVVCGVTKSMADGNLIVTKVDFSGNVIWNRQIAGAYSWYSKGVQTGTGFSWGINCQVDMYGDVVVAYEETGAANRGGLLTKFKDASGNYVWTKKYKTSNGDGFHGITVANCTYLASGWFHSTSYKYGLVMCDTSGYVGGGGQGGTIAKTSTTPVINVAAYVVTTANLATAGNYASPLNTARAYSKGVVVSGTSTTCNIPLPVELTSIYGYPTENGNIIKVGSKNSFFSTFSSINLNPFKFTPLKVRQYYNFFLLIPNIFQ